jgi:hypothetical protein
MIICSLKNRYLGELLKEGLSVSYFHSVCEEVEMQKMVRIFLIHNNKYLMMFTQEEGSHLVEVIRSLIDTKT